MSPNNMNASSDPGQLWEKPWNKMTYFWHNDCPDESTLESVQGNILDVPDCFLLRPRNWICRVIEVDGRNIKREPFIRISDNLPCEPYGATKPRLSGRIKAPPKGNIGVGPSTVKEDYSAIPRSYPKYTPERDNITKRFYKIKKSRNIIKFDKGAIQRWKEEEERNKTKEVFRKIRDSPTFKHCRSSEPSEYCHFCYHGLSPFGFCKECMETSENRSRLLPTVEEESNQCTCSPCSVENSLCNLQCQMEGEDRKDCCGRKTCGIASGAATSNTYSNESGNKEQSTVDGCETHKSDKGAPCSEGISSSNSHVCPGSKGETEGSSKIGSKETYVSQKGCVSASSESKETSQTTEIAGPSGERPPSETLKITISNETGSACSHSESATDTSHCRGIKPACRKTDAEHAEHPETSDTTQNYCVETGTSKITTTTNNSERTGEREKDHSGHPSKTTCATGITAESAECRRDRDYSNTTKMKNVSPTPTGMTEVYEKEVEGYLKGLKCVNSSDTSPKEKDTRNTETQTESPSSMSGPLCSCQFSPENQFPDPNSFTHPVPPTPHPVDHCFPPVQRTVLKSPFAVGLVVGPAQPSDITIVLYANRILVAEVVQRTTFSESILSQAWDLPVDVDETSIRCFLGEEKLLLLALPLPPGFTWPFLSLPISLGAPRLTIRECHINL